MADRTHKNSLNMRSIAIAAALSVLLVALTLAAQATGSYQEKRDLENRQVATLSPDMTRIAATTGDWGRSSFVLIDANRPYAPSPEQISNLDSTGELMAFSLNPSTVIAPTLLEGDAQDIEQACSYFSDRRYTCGFLIVSLDTGRGIGCDYDEAVYGASAFKGPFAAYVCETHFDSAGRALSNSAKSLITRSIESSDNDSHRSLYNGYSSGLSAWASDLGIDSSSIGRLRFPTYSAQESTTMWAHVAAYLETEGEAASWLAERFENTNVSHLRSAMELGVADGSIACESDWSVRNKAGWISGGPSSTSDAGIIEIDGRRYVMSIMTSAPDSAESREACTQLALTLIRAME